MQWDCNMLLLNELYHTTTIGFALKLLAQNAYHKVFCESKYIFLLSMNVYQVKFKKYKDRASVLLKDSDRVQTLLSSSKAKLESIIESNQKLKEFTEKIGLMLRMLKAQFSGEYTDFPWKSLTMIAGALIYFITPLDLIPDFIPALGLTDDATIVYWIYQSIQEDIEKFKAWENTIEISNP